MPRHGKSSLTAGSVFPPRSARPLPRGPHTLQLAFHLCVHAVLITLSTFVLPAHLLSRKLLDDEPQGPDAAAAAAARDAPGLLASLGLLFSLPDTPHNVALLRRIMWGAVQAVALTQAWALIRFKRWYELGVAIEGGDREAATKANKVGWAKGAELLTLTSVSLPPSLLLVHMLLVLLGAPLLRDIKATAQLSLALTLALSFPILHVLPTTLSSWPLFSSAAEEAATATATATATEAASVPTQDAGDKKRDASKRDSDSNPFAPHPRTTSSRLPTLLHTTTVVPLVCSLLASAALTFDHGRAWLAWPLPSLLGLFGGMVVGDVVGWVGYLCGAGLGVGA